MGHWGIYTSSHLPLKTSAQLFLSEYIFQNHIHVGFIPGVGSVSTDSYDEPDFGSLRLIDVDRLCGLWNVKKSWVYDQVEAGNLPAVRLGKQLRFREADLAGYLAQAAV